MMLEQYEDVVEDWYFHHQDQRLENFLCQNHVLETSDQGRLNKSVSSIHLKPLYVRAMTCRHEVILCRT